MGFPKKKNLLCEEWLTLSVHIRSHFHACLSHIISSPFTRKRITAAICTFDHLSYLHKIHSPSIYLYVFQTKKKEMILIYRPEFIFSFVIAVITPIQVWIYTYASVSLWLMLIKLTASMLLDCSSERLSRQI